jgi:hypothetical protein
VAAAETPDVTTAETTMAAAVSARCDGQTQAQ